MFISRWLAIAGLIGLLFVMAGSHSPAGAQDDDLSECCAYVSGVEDNDVLFVRELPNPNATVVAELAADSRNIMVGRCVGLDGSSQTSAWLVSEMPQTSIEIGIVWCSITSAPMVYFQAGSKKPVFGNIPQGWVNARFLNIVDESVLSRSMHSAASSAHHAVALQRLSPVSPACCFRVQNVMADDSLEIRDVPRASGLRIGSLASNENSLTLGQCVDRDIQSVRARWINSLTSGDQIRGVWCQVSSSASETRAMGWVNAWYLGPDLPPMPVEDVAALRAGTRDQNAGQAVPVLQPTARQNVEAMDRVDIGTPVSSTTQDQPSVIDNELVPDVDWPSTILLILAGLVMVASAIQGRISVGSLFRDAAALCFLLGLSVLLFPLSRSDLVTGINGQAFVVFGIVATSVSFWFELFSSARRSAPKTHRDGDREPAAAVSATLPDINDEKIVATTVTAAPVAPAAPISLQDKAADAIAALSEMVQNNGGVGGISFTSSDRKEVPIGTYTVAYDGVYTAEIGETKSRPVFKDGRWTTERYDVWESFVLPIKSIETFSAAVGENQYSDELVSCSTSEPTLSRSEMQERASFSPEQVRVAVEDGCGRAALAIGKQLSPKRLVRNERFGGGTYVIQSERYVPLDALHVTYTFGDKDESYSGYYAIAAGRYVGGYPKTFLQKFGGWLIALVILGVIGIAVLASL
tara:strand:+ start:1860 stop:3941 length:2082 start_codon:yes stop_codon:yes gene_type:complete